MKKIILSLIICFCSINSFADSRGPFTDEESAEIIELVESTMGMKVLTTDYSTIDGVGAISRVIGVVGNKASEAHFYLDRAGLILNCNVNFKTEWPLGLRVSLGDCDIYNHKLHTGISSDNIKATPNDPYKVLENIDSE